MKAKVKKMFWCNENVNWGTECTGNCSVRRYVQQWQLRRHSHRLGKKGQRFFSMVYRALSVVALNFRHFRMDSDVL